METKVKAFGTTYTVKTWDLNGDMTLSHSTQGESSVNIKTTHKDLGGKKDTSIFKGDFAKLLQSYIIAKEYSEAFNCKTSADRAQKLREQLVTTY